MTTKKIVIFGAGRFAAKHIRTIEKYFEVLAVCDNDEKKHGTKFLDKYPIISVEKAVKDFSENELLIALDVRDSFNTVHAQLESLGVHSHHVNDAIYEECIRRGEKFFLTKEGLEQSKNLDGNDRNIFVLTSPPHSNLGDQAQSMCIEKLLGNRYSGRLFIDEAFVVRDYFELLYIIKQNLKPEDMIYLHSGYRLTDLYMESVYAAEMIMELFGDRKMVFLPQTIHFIDENIKKRFSEEVGTNITVMCRDATSYNLALEMFPNSRNLLFPDMVTSLIGKYNFHHNREGILFCLRKPDDGESMLSDEKARNIVGQLRKYEQVTVTDTSIDEDWHKIANNREYYVNREIERYSTYKIIVTNRFHGMVFGLAANTPVIVLPTRDHKVISGAEWLKQVGYKNIYMCQNINGIEETVSEVLKKCVETTNPDIFYKEYFEMFDPWNI